MGYPLEPKPGVCDPEALLEHFLAYADSRGLELYSAQEEAILEVFADRNLILSTPTGSGKSLVASAMHFRSLALGRRSVYTCPVKALVNEKFLDLCREFGPDNVGMMTGDATVNREAPILCCTAEILANLAARDGEKAAVDDVIMDEFHYYADEERGVAWQIPLLTLSHCRFMLISATLGESHRFVGALEQLTGEPCVVVRSQERPVPLENDYWELTLTEAVERLQSLNRLPVYIVHFTQRSASETAQSLLSMTVCTKEEKQWIKKEMESVTFNTPFGKEIRKLLGNGIGLHHAGLLPKYRVLVEKFAQKGVLKLICGTDTLGVGVNVPIRTVLFTQLCKYGGQKTSILSARDFHQISGRAGRKGFDDLGFVVCLAPEHVVHNLRMERKAAGETGKKRKVVKKRAPERGYVAWDAGTFERLQRTQPETLQSRFRISHGLLLNVLSRDGDGCQAMRQLIRDSHEPEASKHVHRRKAFQLFRSLLERNIIEMVPGTKAETAKSLRVNVELQEDFSLNQTLALYCIDTIATLDTEAEDYALKVLSLVEAILEDPDIILRKQLDKLKSDKVAELKSMGMEYEQRMAELEKMEYPKPERDFIYDTFNTFSRTHPWVGEENIRPKSVAREMYESYAGFSDYVKDYGLQRSEGILLRHLTHVYRVLEHTVPQSFRTKSLDELSEYLEHLLRTTDSSLLEEWERMKHPDSPVSEHTAEVPEKKREIDPLSRPEKFVNMIRLELFEMIRMLSRRQYVDLHERYDFSRVVQHRGDLSQPVPLELERLMQSFFEQRNWIRLDPPARAIETTGVDRLSREGYWKVRQTLVDDQDSNDWVILVEVDLEKSRKEGVPVLEVLDLGTHDSVDTGWVED